MSKPGVSKGSKKKASIGPLARAEHIVSTIGKDIASEVHGYSESNEIDNEDKTDETRLLDDGFQERRIVAKIKRVDLCARVESLVKSRSKSTGTCNSTKK